MTATRVFSFIINKSSLGWASDTLKLAVLFLHFCLLVRLAGLGFNNSVVLLFDNFFVLVSLILLLFLTNYLENVRVFNDCN